MKQENSCVPRIGSIRVFLRPFLLYWDWVTVMIMLEILRRDGAYDYFYVELLGLLFHQFISAWLTLITSPPQEAKQQALMQLFGLRLVHQMKKSAKLGKET